MAYHIAAIPMTLSVLQGHSHPANIFKRDFYQAVQQLIRLQLTQRVARSLCDGCVSWNCSIRIKRLLTVSL